jgi:hypothetical protein
MRRHLAGETEEARRDLERLAIVRKRREEAAKKREATGIQKYYVVEFVIE